MASPLDLLTPAKKREFLPDTVLTAETKEPIYRKPLDIKDRAKAVVERIMQETGGEFTPIQKVYRAGETVSPWVENIAFGPITLLNAIRGIAQAAEPRSTIWRTALQSGRRGVISPETVQPLGESAQTAYPKMPWQVSGALGTAAEATVLFGPGGIKKVGQIISDLPAWKPIAKQFTSPENLAERIMQGESAQVVLKDLPKTTRQYVTEILKDIQVKASERGIKGLLTYQPQKPVNLLDIMNKYNKALGQRGEALIPRIPSNLIKELNLTPEQVTNIGKGIFTGLSKVVVDRLKQVGVWSKPTEIAQPGSDLKGEQGFNAELSKAMKQPYEMTQSEFKNTPVIKYIEDRLKDKENPLTTQERNQLAKQLVDGGMMSIDDFNSMTEQHGFGGNVSGVQNLTTGKPIPSKPVEGKFGDGLKNISQWQTFRNVPLFAHREAIIKALVEGKKVPKNVIDEYKDWGWITSDGTTAHPKPGGGMAGVTLQEAVESYGVKFNPDLIIPITVSPPTSKGGEKVIGEKKLKDYTLQELSDGLYQRVYPDGRIEKQQSKSLQDILFPKEGGEYEKLTPYDTPEIIKTRKIASGMPETININTPERQLLREQWVKEAYGQGAINKNKELDLIVGIPGSGKTKQIAEPLVQEHGSLIIDSDIIKDKTPEMKTLGGVTAQAVHKESALVSLQVMRKARENGDNIVLVLTGKNIDSVRKFIADFKDIGYKIHLHGVDLSVEKAITRSMKRYFKEGGRWVDPYYISNEVGLTGIKNYDILKIEKGVTSYAKYSTDVPKGTDPKIIEVGGPRRYRNGQLSTDIRGSGNGQRVRETVSRKEVNPKSLTGEILKRGGLDPTKLSKDYNLNEIRQSGLGHILKKGGQGLDDIASQFQSEGLINVPENMMPSSYLMELLKSKEGRNIAEKSDLFYKREYAEYIKKKGKEVGLNDKALDFDTNKLDKANALVLEKEINRRLKEAGKPSILKPAEVKGVIREQTGQVKEPELMLLKTQLEFESRAAKEGYREGKVEAKAKVESIYRERRIKLLESLKIKQENTSTIRKNIIDYTKENLPIFLQGKILSMVNSATTQEALIRAFSRIDNYAEINRKKELVAEIRAQVKKLLDSNSLAVEYKDKIRNIIDNVDFIKHREATFQKLRNIELYIKRQKVKGKDVALPEEVINSLKILSRKPLMELTEKEILVLKDKLDLLEQLGKTKLKARQEIYNFEKNKITNDLVAKTENLDKYREIKPGIGEKLSFPDSLKNKISSLMRLGQKLDLAISPMDVIFDILDGSKGTYAGSNYTNFKAKTDINFSKYLDRKYNILKPIDKLSSELHLTDSNFERIGVYAIIQQEGGLEKLLNSGHAVKEIEAIKLTDAEMKWYLAARKALDNLRPVIAEIMKNVYNQELGKVENYFSFMTDWKAMDEAEVFQRVGLNAEEYGVPTKNIEMGFTKTRVGVGQQKIKINALDIFNKHIDNACYLIDMAKDNKMLFEIANSDVYKEVAGARGQKIVLDWLDTISRKGGMQGQQQIQVLDILRRNVGLGILGLKLTSAFIQPTSLIDAASHIGNWAFKGALNIMSKEWFDFVSKFPEIRARIGDDPAFRDYNNLIGRIGMAPLQYLDKLAAMSTCSGSYEKYMTENKIPIDFNNVNSRALQYAQFIMRRTQSSGIFKDVSSAIGRGELTGNRSVDRLILQFQSFMLNKWSIIRHDVWRCGIKAKNPKKAIGMFFWLMLACLTGAGIRTEISKARKAILGKKQDDSTNKFWINFSQEVYQNIPFVGQLFSSAVYGSIPVPVLAVIKSLFEELGWVTKGKKPQTKLKAAVRLGMTTAELAGIPGAAEAKSWYIDVNRKQKKTSVQTDAIVRALKASAQSRGGGRSLELLTPRKPTSSRLQLLVPSK